MQPGGFAEAHRPAQPSRAGQVRLARFQDNGLIQRFVFPAITLADENPEQDGFVRDLLIKDLS